MLSTALSSLEIIADTFKGSETPTEEKEKFVWRMHQPTEPRKYQLFPAKEKLSISAGRKSPDPETVFAVAMGQNGLAEKDRSLLGTVLRTKSKEPTLIRRRKVSVPELGPMTTVQEIAMDSRECDTYIRYVCEAKTQQQRYPAARLCTSDQ
jgi:hypothetical protein